MIDMEGRALPHTLEPYMAPMCGSCELRKADVFWHGFPYCSTCAWKEMRERRKKGATNLPRS